MLDKKLTKKKMLLMILFLVIGSIGFYSILGSRGKEKIPTYSTYQVRKTDPLLFEGKVQAAQEQEEYVDSLLGVISEILVDDGEIIEEGTVLFSYVSEENQQFLDEQNRLHSRTKNRLSEENTNLASAQSDFKTSEANVSEINRQMENHTASNETEIIYDQELESLRSDLATYESDKAEAEGTIERAQITIRELEEQLEDITAEIERLRGNITTVVESTVNGTVELNNSVASRPEFSEEPLVRILSETVVVEATVSEYDYNSLIEGSSVEILLLNSEERIVGEIISIDYRPLSSIDSVDSSSRYRFTVEPEEAIQYGFSVHVSYQDDVIHLPESALVSEDEKTIVFVYKDGMTHKREVSIRNEGNIYILEEGVSIGEKLILNPSPEIEDGEEIVIVDD